MRILLVLLTLGVLADAKRRLKILVSVPGVSYSHLQFQGALADLLVDAGHEVVSIFKNGYLVGRPYLVFWT